MHPLFVLLLAPQVLRMPPLFGKPLATVEKTLGKGRRTFSDRVGGAARQTFQHGEVEVEYVNGRARSMMRIFPDAPEIDWKTALTFCGFSTQKVQFASDGERAVEEGFANDWRLRDGGLPKGYQAVYTHRRVGTRTTEQSLTIEAPYAAVVEPGAPERKALLDLIRPIFEKAFHGQKVKFKVDGISVVGDWAFMVIDPIAAAGGPLDVKNSDFAQQAAEGMMDGSAYILLKRATTGWTIVDRAMFPTDVAWEPWGEKYKAPALLFPNYGM